MKLRDPIITPKPESRLNRLPRRYAPRTDDKYLVVLNRSDGLLIGLRPPAVTAYLLSFEPQRDSGLLSNVSAVSSRS